MTVENQVTENPFPGLRPFEDDEAYLFFGRETQIDELLRRLRSQRFIAVVGTSGSGKSSLIRAGLYSALRVGAMSGAGSRWHIATMRPGNDPVGELAKELEAAELLGSDGDAELRVDLAYAVLERGALGLVEVVRQMPTRSDENVLIVVDQFEELFRYAQTDANAAAAFVNLLLAATAQPELRLYVVLTMRSDFLGDCAGFSDLPERINHGLYLVPRMTREQLEAAIVGPVKVAGTSISPRLVNRLLNDVGDDPDQLPVLAHALMLTFDLWAADHAEGEPIDVRHYSATGGLANAIDVHAERVYATLTPAQQAIAGKLFAAITELGPDNRGIRRPLSLGVLCAVCDASESDVREIVEAYRARSCSFLRPPPEIPLTGGTVVDISHEALMRGWSRLKSLLADEVDSARTFGRLSDAAEQYATAKGALLTDPALGLNLQWRDRAKPTAAWAERYGGNFAVAMAFLERSADERTRQRAERAAAMRRNWTIATAVIVVLVLLTFASVASFLGARSERRESQISQSYFLTRDANAAIERGDAVTGMLLALEALPVHLNRPDRPYFADATIALENGLNTRLERHVFLPSGGTGDMAIAPDGKHIALASADNSIRLYDSVTDAPTLELRGHTSGITWVQYSRDGKRIVTSSTDETARIWDAMSGRVLHVLALKSRCENAAFSPDARFVLTGSDDGLLQIWNSVTGRFVRGWRAKPGPVSVVSDAEYSPDGSRIVVALADKTARVWDARGTRLQLTLNGQKGSVSTAIFSGDGKHIATASGDQTIAVYNARTGVLEQMLRGFDSSVYTVEFSPDSRSLAGAANDGQARVYDVATGTLLGVLAGSEGGLNGAFYSPDGRTIRTSSSDGTVRTWTNPAALGDIVIDEGSKGSGFSYSHDGRFVVSGAPGGSLEIWNATTGAKVLTFRNFRGRVGKPTFSPDDSRIAAPSAGALNVFSVKTGALDFTIHDASKSRYALYSPDGKLIATDGSTSTASLWNANTGALVATLKGHTDRVWGGAFSPDGTRLATTSYDGTARIWDVATGKALRVLRGFTQRVNAAAFSPDGKRILLSSADGTARIYDAIGGKTLHRFSFNKGIVSGAAFTPDGSEIALGSIEERIVRLFDSSTGAPLDVLRGHTDEIHYVFFSPDGRHVASDSADGTLRISPLPPRRYCQDVIDAARAALPRQLSAAQNAEDFLGPRATAPLIDLFGSGATCTRP